MKFSGKSFIATAASCTFALASTAVLAGDDKAAHEEKMTDAPEELKETEEDVQEAVQVFRKVQGDPEFSQAMENAKGLFIMPDYATAALIVGGSGGEGVLVTNTNGEWGNPAFYDVGSISAGLQAGVSAGSIVLALMTDRAVESFKQENNFSLTSAAGLSIINWSARAQGELGEGNDVVVWTDTEGLLGELSVALSDINWDEEENREYYGEPTDPQQVLSGNISSPKGQKFSQIMNRR